jgi:1,4-alpha-glucan branching enzyme
MAKTTPLTTRPMPPLTSDPWLDPFQPQLRLRRARASHTRDSLCEAEASLGDFASGHTYYGLHRTPEGWVMREWAPNATSVVLVGDFNDWEPTESWYLTPIGPNGDWECHIPADAIRHGMHYGLTLTWPGGEGHRLPSYARRIVQDPATNIFSAQVWEPTTPYVWEHPTPPPPDGALLIYETHIGMAQERACVGTYREFTERTLPRIIKAGYNTIQLMAVMEHPYYGSFGYHVANFFAPSSRFGTPEELKHLIDQAHAAGLRVIMDIVHSHAVRNEAEGLARFDGTHYQYFHEGPRGLHEAWDSHCFDYAKPQVLHFLLSNCRYWLDEFHFDGFRFDGITSMLYFDHGLGASFGDYATYFDPHRVDPDAVTYLALANQLIHEIRPDAITIAEDVSGMPGLAAPVDQGGCGFDMRLAMGVSDCWFKLANDTRDEAWDMDWLWTELTNRRVEERTLSYVECHDQALVGGKSMIFELIDEAMYHGMDIESHHLTVDRGLALHKMMRMATLFTGAMGYLNFMGNEFGHPDWIDFPREGNDWSYQHARRQWSLCDRDDLHYHSLGAFDRAIIPLAAEHIREPHTELVHLHNDNKLLVFKRDDLILCFNFHPTNSYTDYPLHVPSGSYKLRLNTDAPEFSGHGQLTPNQTYFSKSDGNNHTIQLYLPARSALILQHHA